MKRMQIAISLLLAGTAMQVQAREQALSETAVPVSVIGTETFDQNLIRLEDIRNFCAINRGHPAYGVNATPGVIRGFDGDGITSEYGTRYGQTINGIRMVDGYPVGPGGRVLLLQDLQRIEILQTPETLNCTEYPDANLIVADNVLPVDSRSADPSLAVQPLPSDVASGIPARTAADVRAELDGLVRLCQNDVDEETNSDREERYGKLFDQLREFDAIRDDLRERLLTNDPDLNQADAIDQLKKLDPAIDGAVFPSQLKCPPTKADLARPQTALSSYDIDAAINYFEQYAILFPEANSPIGETASPPSRSDTGLSRPVSLDPETKPIFNEILVGGSLGSGDFGTSTSGIGFQSMGPGTETFADTAPTKFDTFSLAGGVTFELADHFVGGVHYSYSEGDARKDFDIPAGGVIDVGNVYGGSSPSGSTGLNIGNRGLSGFNEADFSLHEIKLSATTPISEERAFSSSATLFVNALFMDRNHTGQTNATVFGTPITQHRDQEVSDRLFGLGGLLNGRLHVAEGVNAVGSLGGAAYYRNTDMTATETNDCGLCPPADQNFTLTFEESDSGISFAGTVSAGLEFDVTPYLKFLVGADASYISDVGQIINPSSGDQVLAGETTRLGTTSAWRYRGVAGLRLRY